ncbi:prepilin-type N-terminal cleavage/methylation domain-containing protein [Candidatus Uhrbacteria bacterium]|nr:prepilin-type N-terminal cleavage/methylation domain-containing protein [Candidatus Uhrbacteria bacterium]
MIGNKRAGFTVIEMMVAITIFSTIAVIMAQTFVSFNNLHRRIAFSAVLGQDARFLNELLVRESRNKLIDYSAGTLPPVSNTLSLISRDGTQTAQFSIQTAASGNCGTSGVNCIAFSNDAGITWNQITSNKVDVQQFDIIVRPSTDPFNVLTPGNVQPFVTVVVTLQYKSDNPEERQSLQTQTTVASRVYLR